MQAGILFGTRERKACDRGAGAPAVLACCLVLALGMQAALAADNGWGIPPAVVRTIAAEGFAGTLYLPMKGSAAGATVVIIVPDGPDGDPRSGAYVDQLLGAGSPVLDVMLVEGPDALARGVAELAVHPSVQGRPLGAVAFGRGARLALASGVPLVDLALLYPGCDSLERHLPASGPARILLLHGSDDAANSSAACAAFTDTAARSRRVIHRETYAGIGYAWDYPAFSPEVRFRLPRPDGGGRIETTVAPEFVPLAATRVAAFFSSPLRVALRP